MKTKSFYLIFIFLSAIFTSCKKEETTHLSDIGLHVDFGAKKKLIADEMTYETPTSYSIALKKVTLIGTDGTANFVLFNKTNLASSFVFDFTDNNTVHSLLDEQTIPDGNYNAFELEIYYLQMNISIATSERGVERRNFRIYLSDDAESEGGLHQPGDITQINDGVEIGWLLGEGQTPNLDPVTPRVSAYTTQGDGVSWYNFAGKNGADFGPFGDMNFANNAPHPIYKTSILFDISDQNGEKLILNFDVNNCWQFEDKSMDGHFGGDDLDPLDPSKWNMALPVLSVTLN